MVSPIYTKTYAAPPVNRKEIFRYMRAGEKTPELERLVEEEFLTKREAMLISTLTGESILKGLPDPDAMRCTMLNSVLQLLLRDDFI